MEMVTSDTERVQGSKGVELLVVSSLKHTVVCTSQDYRKARPAIYTNEGGEGTQSMAPWTIIKSQKRQRERKEGTTKGQGTIDEMALASP